jgi:hypothetical protein
LEESGEVPSLRGWFPVELGLDFGIASVALSKEEARKVNTPFELAVDGSRRRCLSDDSPQSPANRANGSIVDSIFASTSMSEGRQEEMKRI